MQKNNTNSDLVTIVTVALNAEKLIEKTILSVINQSYRNIEYIIIDGASTDKTVEIIKKYDDKIDYWVSEPDKGIYYAMNKAIKKATGKWINFMNAGDTFFNQDTVNYVMTHKSNTAQLIYGNFLIKERQIIKKPHNKSQWHLHSPFCHQTLFTQTIIMKNELFDTSFRLSADHDFIVKMYHSHKVFFYIDKTIAVFSLGGFAQSNELLMNIESLKVLLDLKIPENEIKQSYWYVELTKNYCLDEKSKVIDLKKIILEKDEIIKRENILTKDFNSLYNTVFKITKYSIFRHPLKKYRSYKDMLRNYHRINSNLRGHD